MAYGKAALKQPGQTVALVFDEAIKNMPGPKSACDNFARQGLKIVRPTIAKTWPGRSMFLRKIW